jgi:DNA-directed RNA polymerase subunit RPC12/RpoP
MKFLCVACDEPMKLHQAGPPERGSLSVVYGCPKCGHRIAMLTNPMETEMVRSLGVRIGPAPAAGVPAAAASAPGAEERPSGDSPGPPPAAETAPPAPLAAGAAGRAAAGGCPFSGMVAEMESARDGIAWTPEALARLENIPDFVRPMARQGVEHYAKSQGHAVVDERVLAEARERFGM